MTWSVRQLIWNQSLRRWYHNHVISRLWQHGRTAGISQYIRIRSFYWALANRLPLNEKETKIFTVKWKWLSTKTNTTFRINYNGSLLTNVMNIKLLGREIGEGLSFSEHFKTVCKKVAQHNGLLKKLQIFSPLLYYNALIRPGIHCASVLWTNCDKESLGRVLKAPKTRNWSDSERHPSSTISSRLKWWPFYKGTLTSNVAYKRLQGDVPVYLNNVLKLSSSIHNRQTRYCNFILTSPR